MDAVLDQFDKTFQDQGDKTFEEQIDVPNKYVHTEMTTSSTQTPNWNKGREKRSVVGNLMGMVEPKFLSGELRKEIKYILNVRKETLREYYRIRLYLLHEKENKAPSYEKASFAAKYQRILDEFDAKKIKMKRDFETKDPNKLLKQYRLQLVKEQEAVNQLSTTLNQIRNGTSATELNLLVEDGDGHDDDSTMDDEGNDEDVGQNPIEESNKEEEQVEVQQSIIQESSDEDEGVQKEAEGGLEDEAISHRSENTSSEQRTSAEIESIPEELPDESQKKILRKQKQAEDGVHDDSTIETSMDDVDSSFKTYEKSLGSILTSVRTNITTGRESACRRRSSAGEALIKLRMMHGGIPPLSAFKDPAMESKSPPNTPKSPLTNDRFVAKFPHQHASREASFSEDFPPIAAASISDEQMLDELPNTSEIAMLLDISQSPTSSKDHFNFSTKIAKRVSAHQLLDKFADQKKLVEKCGQLLWKEYLEKGDEYDGSYPNLEDMANEAADEEEGANEIMSTSMIRQLCCECLLTLIQTAHSNATSRHALSSEQEMIAYFKKEVLLPVIEPQKATICSEGVRARAEKTSHFQLTANRLLASKYLYEELSVWPNQNLLKSIDQAVIEKLSFI